MGKKKCQIAIITLLAPLVLLFGGTGRPEDGFLAFLVILAFLGLILTILYLVDHIKILLRRFFEKNGDEILP